MLAFVRDSAYRALPLIATSSLIFLESSERVVDFVLMLFAFNVSSIVFNFGAQFYKSYDEAFVKAKDTLHLVSAFFCVAGLFFEDYRLLLSSVLLGLVYARVNEFYYRRLGYYWPLYLFTVILVIPRLIAFLYQVEYWVAALCSAFMLFGVSQLIHKRSGLLSKEAKGSRGQEHCVSIVNYAFLTSLVYVLYQQLPSLVAITEDVSVDGRIEQVISRCIFAFIFIKSSIVVILMRKEEALLSRKYLRVVSILLVILAISTVYASVGGFGGFFILLPLLLFVGCEIAFSFVSAKRHREYDYKSFLIDNMVLLLSSLVFLFFNFELLSVFALSSFVLFFLRGFDEIYLKAQKAV